MKTFYLSSGWMADTPAAVDRKSGTLYINPKLYMKLTPFQKKYVLLHEYGHYNLQTESEIEADTYAFNQLAGTEFRSLKQCIECLETLLDESKIGHKVRIDHMYNLAQQWDEQNISKATSTEQTAREVTQDSAYQEVINSLIANNSNQLNSVFNGIQNTLNSVFVSAVLIIAMILILKD